MIRKTMNLLTQNAAFTMAGAGQRTFLTGLCACGQRPAFTMAEILLSLTIIGVVAAITLPSLTGNINERTWNTQRKALYARMSQAVALMPALNGYGTNADNAAEAFITSGLAKVLKINNICSADSLGDCGIPANVHNHVAGSFAFPTTLEELNPTMISYEDTAGSTTNVLTSTKAAAFETANGESIAVFYNPVCNPDMNEKGEIQTSKKVCANLVYDLNGKKGPNTFGKDMGFITIFYPSDSKVVAPIPAQSPQSITTVTWDAAKTLCKNHEGEYRLPNKEEAASMFVNKRFLRELPSSDTANYWTSTLRTNTSAHHIWWRGGILGSLSKTSTGAGAWCVQR